MNAEELLALHARQAIKELYGQEADSKQLQVQKTRKDFEGDLTLVVFPLLRLSRKKPEDTADELGRWLCGHEDVYVAYNVVKGFLNLSLSPAYWLERLNAMATDAGYGLSGEIQDKPVYMVEYSSPNTNKPLHLGHIRNNLLGWSVSQILKAAGHKTIMVNLVNDRGIHICKSMLAWQKWGRGQTPDSTGTKGDKLVGDYYVKFDQEYKKQINGLVEKGVDKEQAEKEAPLIKEAREMLRKWEAGEAETVKLWEKMNGWVYEGFDQTYARLGIRFDKVYYESQTWKQGKAIVLENLEKGVLQKEADGSVWADLTDDGLDRKLLLRSDGTAVYMTQDIGTAVQRFTDYSIDRHIYVVGNEQDYHFKVLGIILGKFGYPWAGSIKHLSYGMVELPEGKMKSREGTVVDADELMDKMEQTARETSEELGKMDFEEDQASEVYRQVGLGALKYFILKVDPKKKMLFDPKESIDFNGNTGPFIQYTHARICSVLRKAEEQGIAIPERAEGEGLPAKEKQLLSLCNDLPAIIREAAASYSPALVANYAFELAKEYNQFYQECPILKEEDSQLRGLRLLICQVTASALQKTLRLLGIEAPERM